MKENYKHGVMMTAHEMWRSGPESWSECLMEAWRIYRLLKKLREGPVSFTYQKADGRVRRATGTLKGASEKVKGTGKKNYKTVCYFDLEAGEFRSFKAGNLITVY